MKFIKAYKVFESIDDDLSSREEPDGLEEQIAFNMKWWPTLYDSRYGRIKTLAHMYLSYGVGYHWNNGKLQDQTGLNNNKAMYDYRIGVWTRKKVERQKELERLYKQWDVIYNIQKRYDHDEDDDYLTKIQDEIEKLHDEIDYFNPYGKEYPNETPPFGLNNIHLSQYSPIFSIPEDIQPDYLEGAKEILEYIILLGCEDKKILKVAKELGI